MELGLTHATRRERAAAVRELRQAVALRPGARESILHLGPMIEKLSGDGTR